MTVHDSTARTWQVSGAATDDALYEQGPIELTIDTLNDLLAQAQAAGVNMADCRFTAGRDAERYTIIYRLTGTL